jgi:hypothetical protein
MLQNRVALETNRFRKFRTSGVGLAGIFAWGFTGIGFTSADVTYNDGAAHTINSSVSQTVNVGPTEGTTLNVVSPARITGDAAGDSINISGGTVNVTGGAVTAPNIPPNTPQGSDAIYFSNIGVGGSLNISGGTVSAGISNEPPGESQAILVDNPAAQITISGGLVTSGSGGSGVINMNMGGSLTITGGTIQNEVGGGSLPIFNRGLVNIYGGTIESTDGDILNQGGTVNIYGGTFTGSGFSDISTQIGTINIYGLSFNYPFGPISPDSGELVGTLSNGTPIDATFDRTSGSAIVLVQLPEPADALLLAVGCLGLLLGRQRRRI